MTYYIEVLDDSPPNAGPLLAAFHAATGDSLSREQDRARMAESVERFATIVSSLRAGESTPVVSDGAWDHHWASVMVCGEPIVTLTLMDRVRQATVTVGPTGLGAPTIALVSASASSWRDATTLGMRDDRLGVQKMFEDLYRSFCAKGYAALWRDYRATSANGRLLLERK